MRSISSLLLSAGLVLCSLTATAGPVDINTADASTLAKELNGVGPARAQAIVAYRNEHGPFKSVDDLALVKNMPRKLIEDNRDSLRVGGAPARPARGRQAGTRPRGCPGRPSRPEGCPEALSARR